MLTGGNVEPAICDLWRGGKQWCQYLCVNAILSLEDFDFQAARDCSIRLLHGIVNCRGVSRQLSAVCHFFDTFRSVG